MATRESQGLQIALILFVMVSVVLAVTTFVFYRGAEEAKKTAADEEAKATAAANGLRNENFKVQYLKHILGAQTLTETELDPVVAAITADDEMKAIDDRYQQDMQTYIESDQVAQNYQTLPQHMLMALREKNVGFSGLTGDVNRLNEKTAQVEQSEQKRTQTAQAELQKAKDDLADERAKFASFREQMDNQKNKMASDQKKARDRLSAELGKRQQALAKASDDNNSLQTTVTQQEQRIVELIDEPFDVADGQVTWVNQSSRTVWINLGLADGLRRQTTFSVYDQEALNVAPRRAEDDTDKDEESGVVRMADMAKGKLEVTRVIDQHLAEARIVEDSASDPILKGDQVFSPAWKPGRRIRFALLGFMDINGDRRSDRSMIRNIITAGGGVIDAEVHDDGTTEGELTPRTRYLVFGGEPPTLTNTTIMGAYNKMYDDAKRLGIQRIDVLHLLDLMGYKAEVQTVQLGRGLGSGVPTRANEGARPIGSSEEGFRERTPPSRSGDSAF